MDADDWADIEARFDQLSFDAKLRLIERLVRRLRRGAFADPVAFEREMNEMAADPDVKRELGPAGGQRP
jgi:hypothetical protein